ncbi:MAG: endonuclease III domain-containing protein [Planctomycetota bacterium]
MARTRRGEVDARHLADVSRRLVRHFGRRKYRPRGDALGGLVLTVLSQNTTDLTAARAFRRLRERYSSWEKVLAAPRRRVEDALQVCGLHQQKARTIQEFLKRLKRERGRLSLAFLKRVSSAEAVEWLTASPGIGTKTAAVVLLFRLGHALMPVDTHIRRVCGRVGLVPEGTPAGKVQEALAPVAPRTAAGCAQMHLDLIWLGREVCGARAPQCPTCPLLDVCRYARKRRVRRAG